MVALALGLGGHVDASNQLQQTQTNRVTCGNSIRAGERQAHVFNTNLSLFLPAAAGAIRESALRLVFLAGAGRQLLRDGMDIREGNRPAGPRKFRKMRWKLASDHQRFLNANCRY
jgi:hypothetical protein